MGHFLEFGMMRLEHELKSRITRPLVPLNDNNVYSALFVHNGVIIFVYTRQQRNFIVQAYTYTYYYLTRAEGDCCGGVWVKGLIHSWDPDMRLMI